MLPTVAVALSILKISSALSGVIWSKTNQKFVSLYEIASFSDEKSKFLSDSRELERHNFQKAVLKAVYYEEPNLVNFIDNDTKISGVIGEIWNIMADYLNFTLVPINTRDRNFGDRLENGSYDGILGLIERNESQIIPRSGIFAYRLSLVQYVLPMWKIRYRLYIKPETRHDEAWVIHLFSERVWYSFFFLLLILSLAGYVCERYSPRYGPRDKSRCNLRDHVFYAIALASTQGCVPAELHERSRTLYLVTSLFSYVILTAFSSHAIYVMMNWKIILPFDSLKDLMRNTKYHVVAFSGSMVHQQFEAMVAKHYRGIYDYGRVSYAPSAEELYKKVCFSMDHKYAAFEAVDRHKAIGKSICRLIPAGISYFETWTASAVKRGFRYKRSFDIGILKMHESGLVDGLRDRWLDWKMDDNQEVPFQSIDISQTLLIFGVMCSGFVLSVAVLACEYVVFFANRRIARRRREAELARLKMTRSRKNRVVFSIK